MVNILGQLKESAQQRFGVKPTAETITALECWLATPLGDALLRQEKETVAEQLKHLYGYHLLQLGISRSTDFTASSTINHKFSLSPLGGAKTAGQWYAGAADPERLPLDAESLDVVVLHHILEFTPHPHQLLREAARVTIPRGYLVIIGFNPYSWFGLFKKFGLLFTGQRQWRHHALRIGRLKDWLRLLDFEPLEIKQGFFRWPINNEKFLGKTLWFEKLMQKSRLPLGGYYVIVARKDVVGMTLIKPSWKMFNPLENLVGTSPTSRVADSASLQRPLRNTNIDDGKKF